MNREEIASLGAKDIEQINVVDKLSVYPNPSFGDINLSFDSGQEFEGTAMMIDLVGRVVWSDKLSIYQGKNEWYINTDNYSAGMYHLLISAPDKVHSSKVILQK